MITRKLFAVSLLLAGSAFANQNSDLDQLLSLSLEELLATKVKISTNTEQPLVRAPAVVSVITAEDIKATGATNLTEVMQSVPGVYVRTNGFGFRPFVTFRGASSAHTLLMIDGAPVKDMMFASGMFWKGIAASAIDRIEIMRGPGSALFGSDASAGVVNVITKTAGRIRQSEAGARAGSFGTEEGWLQHGTSRDGFDFNLTADVFHTNGYSPYIASDRQTLSDTSTHVSLAPGRVHNGYDNQDLRFSLAHGHWRLQGDYMSLSDVETGLTGGGVIDPLTHGGNHRYNLDLFYDNGQFAEDWGLNAELRYLHLDYSTGNGTQERPPGYANAYPQGQLSLQRGAENRISAEISGLYSGFDKHAISIGSGYVSQDLYSVQHLVNYGTGPNGVTLPDNGPLVDISGTPYAFAPQKARQIRYLFLQDIWTIAPNWELTAGARYDHYSDFGPTFNPRLALVWQSTERLVAKLMYGQAFVAPSFLQLYSITGATVGNPNLKPERSKTIDIAFSYAASKDLTLGIDFYRFLQSDVIGQGTGNLYQNVGTMSSHGIELEAKWQATPTLRLSGSASNRIEDYSSSRSYNVPKQMAYVRGDWAFMPRWNWDVQANRIGKHLLPAAAPKPIGAYTLVDTTVRFAYSKDWEFAASIRNLFDVDAREFVGNTATAYISENLPLPGRNLYAEARYRF